MCVLRNVVLHQRCRRWTQFVIAKFEESRLAMSGSLEGKVVVVSGASMGVGRATAERLARERAPAPPKSAAALEQGGAKFGRVDILVNSAGASRIRLIEEASDEDIAVTVHTNLIAPMDITRPAIRLL